jgi:hypothetical protein
MLSIYAENDDWGKKSPMFFLKQLDFVTQCKHQTSDRCARQFAHQIGMACSSLVTQLILTGCFLGDSLSPPRRGVNGCSQKRTQRTKGVAAYRLFSVGSGLGVNSHRVVNNGECVSETLPRKSRKLSLNHQKEA